MAHQPGQVAFDGRPRFCWGLMVMALLLLCTTVAGAAPANDEIAHAMVITALPFTDGPLDTTGATTAPDDPDCAGNGPTVWYMVAPAADLSMIVNTFGSTYDTTVSVYTGTPGALTQLACNDDFQGAQSQVVFPAVAGTTYYIMVGSYASGPGGSLLFQAVEAGPSPGNDEIVHATVITALPFTDGPLDTTGATTAPDDPGGCAGGTNVWYTFTPSEAMVIRLTTAGSSYDAFLDVFVSSAGALSHTGLCAFGQLDFQASAGTTYYFMVSAPAFGGDLVFSVLTLGPPFQVTLHLKATGSVDPKTGSATIKGTVTCAQPAGATVQGQLRQKLGRRTIIQGNFVASVNCDEKTPWSATVRSDQGAFGRGYAEVLASASGCGLSACDDDKATATIQLRAEP